MKIVPWLVAAVVVLSPLPALAQQPAPPAPAPPAPPPAAAPADQGPPPVLAPPPTEAPVAPNPVTQGQWVYTASYGWVWVPTNTVPYDVSSQPYVYLYTPSYGWTWYVSPWGWGPFHIGPWVTAGWGAPRVWGHGRWFAPGAGVSVSIGPRPLHVGPRYVGPRYVGPRYVGPRYVGPRYVAPRYVHPHYAAPRYAPPHFGRHHR